MPCLEILILDEPVNGLDPQGIADVRSLIVKLNAEYGTTVVISSHILGELEHTATRFGIIDHGQVLREITHEDLKVRSDKIQIRVSDYEKAKRLLADNDMPFFRKVPHTSLWKITILNWWEGISMTNYLNADLRRILRKQSFLGSVGVFVLLFVVMVFIDVNPSFTTEMYVAKVTGFLSFFPLVIGVFVFISVYADDFKCRSMQVAIGYGIPRSHIILAKLMESTILLFATAGIIGGLVLYAPVVLGLVPNTQQLVSLALTVAVEMIRAQGYLALSTVPVFFSQDAVGGIVAYVLLSSKTVYIVLSMVLGQELLVNTIGDLTDYLYTVQLYTVKAELMEGAPFIFTFVAALLIYIVLPTGIAIIGFRKKELEF